MAETPCPTPTKSRFATLEMAQDAARRAGFALRKRMHVYDTCSCGWLHLTSATDRPRSEPVLVGDGPFDDNLIAMVTREDVWNRCAEQDSAYLRRPESLHRWADALKTYQISLGAQMAIRKGRTDPATEQWRVRIRKTEERLRERRDEAKHLNRVTHQQRNRIAPADADLKEKRRVAGERAIDRLKGAHTAEFVTYLIEEFQADGLEIPDTYRKYLKKEET